MKKDKLFIILGAVLLALQLVSFAFDLIQTGALKLMPDFSGDGLMYNISYLSVGIVGALVIVWGIIIGRRKED